MDAVECWYHYFLDRQAYNNFAAYLFLAHIGSILTPSLFQPGCYPPSLITPFQINSSHLIPWILAQTIRKKSRSLPKTLHIVQRQSLSK